MVATVVCAVGLVSCEDKVYSRGPLSSGPCQLSFRVRQHDQWHDLVEGFLFAMLKDPPESVRHCYWCDKIGKHVGGS